MSKAWRQVLVFLVTFTLFSSLHLFAQSTVSTGSIQGTVTDPSGAAVPNAKVTITNVATRSAKTVNSNSSGFYNSGSITPGSYKIRVEASGFEAIETTLVAQVGNTVGYNPKLQVGSSQQTVEVEASFPTNSPSLPNGLVCSRSDTPDGSAARSSIATRSASTVFMPMQDS